MTSRGPLPEQLPTSVPAENAADLPLGGLDTAETLKPAPRALTAHRKPLPALTGLRFFAALHVIVFHTTLKTTLLAQGHILSGNLLANGFLAVTLFFMLSGFILAYNYRGQIETRNHAFRFWEARYARIWPAYVFSLLCCSIPLSLVPRFPVAVATIFMIQAWDPFHPIFSSAWNGVCWSLSVEAFFYLFFPWMQTSIEKLRASRLALLGLVVGLAGILWAGPTYTSSERFAGVFSYVIIPIIHLPEFIAGIVLGNTFINRSGASASGTSDEDRMADRRPVRGGQFLRNLPWLTILGTVSSFAIFATLRNRWTGLVIVTFSLLLYGLAAERSLLSRFLSTRLLILGGEISYAMYLLRTPVHTWVSLFPALAASRLVSLLYIPFLLMPLSLFSYYAVEGPSRRGLRRFFAALQRRPT